MQNLPHLLKKGLCTKHHPGADPKFIPIGNPSIIDRRDDTAVRIQGYGNIGDYIPFYFTPRSIMHYNIVTGHYAPVVPKVEKEDILVTRAEIIKLTGLDRFFFTDGQANTAITTHFNDIASLGHIDWPIIHYSDFKKSESDQDKQRRYHAEFLVHGHIPVSYIESLFVYNDKAATFVEKELNKAKVNLPVHINTDYFFG